MSIGSATTAALLSAAALLCAWRANAARRSPPEAQGSWRLCAGALLLLSLAHALALDHWVLTLGRAAARQAGLYEARRPFQAALLLLLCGLLMLGVVRREQRAQRDEQPQRANHRFGDPQRACLLATAVLGALFLMRTVSLHGLDAVLEFRCLGLGLGRWFEWAAAGVVMAGTLASARQRPGPQAGLRAWVPPHV